jgi:hypothetical protein
MSVSPGEENEVAVSSNGSLSYEMTQRLLRLAIQDLPEGQKKKSIQIDNHHLATRIGSVFQILRTQTSQEAKMRGKAHKRQKQTQNQNQEKDLIAGLHSESDTTASKSSLAAGIELIPQDYKCAKYDKITIYYPPVRYFVSSNHCHYPY